MDEQIELKGIRTHNLKNLNIQISRGSLTVITGVSGSGKSSLAFDTLYAEGRRRYVESLSTYARQFLERVERPDLDYVNGMPPAIAIEAKNVVTNARSTVGTQTEIYDYLRLLYARIGTSHCISCGREITIDQPAHIFENIQNQKIQNAFIAFPFHLTAGKKPSLESIFSEFDRQGFLEFMISSEWLNADQARQSSIQDLKLFYVLVDQLAPLDQNRSRFIDSLESAFRYGKGDVSIFYQDGKNWSELKYSNRFHCALCNIEYREPDPNSFSFNSPLGACSECQGFGRVITIDWDLVVPNADLSISAGAIGPFMKPSTKWEFKQLKEFCLRRDISTDVPFSKLSKEKQRWILEGCSDDKDFFSVREFFAYLEKKTYKMHVRIFLSKYRGYIECPNCKGKRLKPEFLNVTVSKKNIAELCGFTLAHLKEFFDHLRLSAYDESVAGPILIEIKKRVSFLVNVGLGYLTLDRLSRTLSGGEAQRIHLATSLGSALMDTLYVLDEPSVGLHDRDNALLIKLLKELKNLGNTVVVVEHDKAMIEAADEIIDLGPLGGEKGGHIVFSGPFKNLQNAKESYTGRYFRGDLKIERHHPVCLDRQTPSLVIRGAKEHNLKDIDLNVPLGGLVVITGVSGSGKSTFMYDVLYNNYLRYKGQPVQDVGKIREIKGWENLDDLVLIDQSPIGRTPRSNPVTYVKVFDAIRKLFASTREARAKRFTPGFFSFNVTGGRCENCEGDGVVKIEMHFLADVSVVCEACGGTRFQNRILDIRYRGKNIHDVLEMTVHEALEFFNDRHEICDKLSILDQVGLGYLRLGQSATTLSGGEAQRLKLACEIAQKNSKRLLYLFDEPTTGLHYHDIKALLAAFETLVERGHSLCVIEHNMEIIKCADYIIDLGPEGGDAGGQVIYSGPGSGILRVKGSHTGVALKKYLGLD